MKPAKRYRLPSEKERAALADLDRRLAALPKGVLAEEIQSEVYAVGKEHGFEPLRGWFAALYEVLLGQTQGPRFGSFVELYGVAETRALIKRALAGELSGLGAPSFETSLPPPPNEGSGPKRPCLARDHDKGGGHPLNRSPPERLAKTIGN